MPSFTVDRQAALTARRLGMNTGPASSDQGSGHSMTSVTISTTARNALVVIAVILAGAALRWMADIITPLLLAVFLAIMVDGFSRVLRRRLPWLPPGGAVAAAIVISAVVSALTAVVVASNASGFLTSLAKA